MLLLLTAMMAILLTGSVWGDVTLRIESGDSCPSSIGVPFTFCMDNPDDVVAAIQVDILFDTECFTVTAVSKTDRSADMDFFNYVEITEGIRIAITGIGHQIDSGTGPIAAIDVDVGNCAEDDYPFDLTGCVVANPLGGEITCIELDNEHNIHTCDHQLYVSSTEFDLGDVCIGQTGLGMLTVSSSGDFDFDVWLTAEGCAGADPTAFSLYPLPSQDVMITCRPEEDGPCRGLVLVSNGPEEIPVSVTCNGVIPLGLKGDINSDGSINILDVVRAVNIALGIHVPTSEVFCTADCNGPIGNCEGDGIVDVSDVMKMGMPLSLRSLYTSTISSSWYQAPATNPFALSIAFAPSLICILLSTSL